MLNKRPSSHRSFKVLRNQILALSIGLFLLSLSIKVFQTRSQRLDLGKAIALSVERDLEIGDLRAAMTNLERSAKGSFSGLQYVRLFPKFEREVFQLGDTANNFTNAVFVHRLRPMEQDEIGSELRFHFDLLEDSAIFALLTIPAFAILGWLLLKNASERFRSELALISAAKQAEEKAQFAAQIGHDIRSPLAAINAAERDFVSLPEETRFLLKSATSRIVDIANNLLRIEGSNSIQSEATPKPHLLTDIIDSILSEKRAQYSARLDIDISSQSNTDVYGVFVEVQLQEAKRVLSNLIDNAVEALGRSGKVVVEISASETEAFIRVIDNGKGIAPDILPKLCQRGQTYGKVGGSGLGLFHAKTVIEAWNGNLEIRSELGCGTNVRLSLLRAKAPDWFMSEIQLAPNARVVVLDDDQSVHRIWRNRASSRHIVEASISFVHISTPEELRMVASSPFENQTTYFLDFELLNSKESGLDLAEELKISNRSTLVTSYYSFPSVIEKSSKLAIKMIPKALVGSVPIHVNEGWDGYLLDDDDLTCRVWKAAAKRAGKRLRVFSRPEDLLDSLKDVNHEMPFYLDSHLGIEVKGEDIASILFNLGFRELYLVTGFPKEHFKGPCPHIKAILSKEPVWTYQDIKKAPGP